MQKRAVLPAMLRPADSKIMRRTKKAKCANCGGSFASEFKGCSSYQNAVVEATMRKQDIKYSAVAKRQTEMVQPNSTISAINISVLAKVLSKTRPTFNTMFYSDIINVISISPSRIFGDKKEGQKIHDSIKNANNIFTNVPTQQVSTNIHQFSQH